MLIILTPSFLFHSRLLKLGFHHNGKGAIDSIVNGKELEKFIADQGK
jgi:hypothetical protein